MQLEQAMQALEQAGTAQTCKTYRRHGVQDPMFGVLTSSMDKLSKQIKVDHALAQELWATGNHDARILATRIADPKQADSAQLDQWVNELDNYVISDALASYVARTPLIREKIAAWTPVSAEWVGATGWTIVADLAMRDKQLTDEEFRPYLATIEREIHSRANRVRYSMNNALIAIGLRSPDLQAEAIAAAERIGLVEVDHGETNCKTPDAVPYIRKAAARKVKA